jgi:hypothetical protein
MDPFGLGDASPAVSDSVYAQELQHPLLTDGPASSSANNNTQQQCPPVVPMRLSSCPTATSNPPMRTLVSGNHSSSFSQVLDQLNHEQTAPRPGSFKKTQQISHLPTNAHVPIKDRHDTHVQSARNTGSSPSRTGFRPFLVSSFSAMDGSARAEVYSPDSMSGRCSPLDDSEGTMWMKRYRALFNEVSQVCTQ